MVELFRPGQKAPYSGFWARVDEFGDDELSEGGDALETDVSEGNRFPPGKRKGWTYRFSRGPVHSEDE